MGNNQNYKNRALQSLEGKWANGAIATLIVFLISGGIREAITLPMGNNMGLSIGTSSIWSLLCLPLSWGFSVYFLNLIRQQDISYERLFDGYKDFVRIFLAEFVVGFCVFIGTFLFIVPGIVVALMFSQTAFVLKDNKDMSASEAMKESARLMKGHKARLLWLYLSFIGWGILALLTLGIGFFLLCPYIISSEAHFYEDLKAEQDE